MNLSIVSAQFGCGTVRAIVLNQQLIVTSMDIEDPIAFDESANKMAIALDIPQPIDRKLTSEPSRTWTNWQDVMDNINQAQTIADDKKININLAAFDATHALEQALNDATCAHDIGRICNDFDLHDLFDSNNTLSHIEDETFHAHKDYYVQALNALSEYLYNDSNHATPINAQREAKYGGYGINTVGAVVKELAKTGFATGLLTQSGYLGVDDAKFHALNAAYADAHYQLMDTIGHKYIRFTSLPFEPMQTGELAS